MATAFAAAGFADHGDERTGDVGGRVALFEQAVDVVLIGVEFSGFEAFLEIVENQVRAAAFDLLDGRDALALDDAGGCSARSICSR